MRLGIVSDLHLEFSDCAVPCDGIDVLILAGDTHTHPAAIGAFVDGLLGRYPELHVVLVPGNHEYYSKTVMETEDQLEALGKPRFHVLLNSSATVNGVQFVGGTLWAMIPHGMRHHYITDYGRIPGLGAALMERECGDCIDAIMECTWKIEGACHDKLVVVTHFAPSRRSIHSKYGNPAVGNNCYYASDLDGTVAASGAALWVHGHTHSSMDYTIGDTRVLCNPRGYSKTADAHPENPDFVCPLVVTI